MNTDEVRLMSLAHCGWPDCPASFDRIAQMDKGPYVYGWLQGRVFEYLCPDHANAGHTATIDYVYYQPENSAAKAVCPCGWTGDEVLTLSAVTETWRQHVREVTS